MALSCLIWFSFFDFQVFFFIIVQTITDGGRRRRRRRRHTANKTFPFVSCFALRYVWSNLGMGFVSVLSSTQANGDTDDEIRKINFQRVTSVCVHVNAIVLDKWQVMYNNVVYFNAFGNTNCTHTHPPSHRTTRAHSIRFTFIITCAPGKIYFEKIRQPFNSYMLCELEIKSQWKCVREERSWGWVGSSKYARAGHTAAFKIWNLSGHGCRALCTTL